MKIGLVSLGCPKNLVDSEVMLGLAQQAGHELTQDPSGADVLVVNTCAFIDSAKQESVDAILEMARHKKDGACRRLIVTGCLAERYRDELHKEIPEIDAVLGTGEVPDIVKAIGGMNGTPQTAPLTFYTGAGAPPPARANADASPRICPSSARHGRRRFYTGAGAPRVRSSEEPTSFGEARQSAAGATATPPARADADALAAASLGCGSSFDEAQDDPELVEGSAWPPAPCARSTKHTAPGTRPSYIYDADTPRLLATPRHYAYVKIAEGCDYKCAFCIIPTLRGSYRSRPSDSIVREARALAAHGVKELLLISQDTTFYGIDRQERGALARLLRELNTIDGLEWIRLLYLYPTTIDADTLAAMAECEKVCKYIDLPLQHASNAVLKGMKRPGTRQKYDRLLRGIRHQVPGVALRTTFIVGFPGETEKDVDELCEFVGEHAFDHVGVFTYSHEEGTAAYTLDDDVPHPTKSRRRNRVMSLQKRLVRRRQRARVGEKVRMMVDGPAGEHELVLKGRLSSQAPDIDAAVYLTDCDPSSFTSGDFAEVEIVGARDYDLIARPAVL